MAKIATLMPIPAFAAVERPEEVAAMLEGPGDSLDIVDVVDASEIISFAVWVVWDFTVLDDGDPKVACCDVSRWEIPCAVTCVAPGAEGSD